MLKPRCLGNKHQPVSAGVCVGWRWGWFCKCWKNCELDSAAVTEKHDCYRGEQVWPEWVLVEPEADRKPPRIKQERANPFFLSYCRFPFLPLLQEPNMWFTESRCPPLHRRQWKGGWSWEKLSGPRIYNRGKQKIYMCVCVPGDESEGRCWLLNVLSTSHIHAQSAVFPADTTTYQGTIRE